jgi:hypothetical protein
MKWYAKYLINGVVVERELYTTPLIWFKKHTYSAEKVLELALNRWIDTVGQVHKKY